LPFFPRRPSISDGLSEDTLPACKLRSRASDAVTPTKMKSSSLSSLGNVEVEAVPKLGEVGFDTDFVGAATLHSGVAISACGFDLFVASVLPFTLLSPLSEPPEGVLTSPLDRDGVEVMSRNS
jgi:hypothetical protein